MRKVLKNKPLVEAIFELRWELYEQLPTGEKIDPYYKVLFGGIYNKLRGDYPLVEPLPAADIPERFSGYIVQHRFRGRADNWPLIQVGPGVVTLNDTAGYIWETFRERALQLVEALFEIHPRAEELVISKAMLRYIDGIEFDYEQTDIFGFLKEQMKTELCLFPKLFEDTGVEKTPEAFDMRFSFPSTSPNGVVLLRIARGTKKNDDTVANALIWETIVDSSGENSPSSKEMFPEWIDQAHELTDDWFFKIIAGELERRFE